jgi:IS5 family transposase
MSTPDFFRARLDGMVDPRHLLVVLTNRLPWTQIGQVLAPHFERKARTPGTVTAPGHAG